MTDELIRRQGELACIIIAIMTKDNKGYSKEELRIEIGKIIQKKLRLKTTPKINDSTFRLSIKTLLEDRIVYDSNQASGRGITANLKLSTLDAPRGKIVRRLPQKVFETKYEIARNNLKSFLKKLKKTKNEDILIRKFSDIQYADKFWSNYHASKEFQDFAVTMLGGKTQAVIAKQYQKELEGIIQKIFLELEHNHIELRDQIAFVINGRRQGLGRISKTSW